MGLGVGQAEGLKQGPQERREEEEEKIRQKKKRERNKKNFRTQAKWIRPHGTTYKWTACTRGSKLVENRIEP